MRINKFKKTNVKQKAETAKGSRAKVAPGAQVIEITKDDERMSGEIMATLCMWSCGFLGMEPTADNMRSAYDAACNRARVTLEMQDFASQPTE